MHVKLIIGGQKKRRTAERRAFRVRFNGLEHRPAKLAVFLYTCTAGQGRDSMLCQGSDLEKANTGYRLDRHQAARLQRAEQTRLNTRPPKFRAVGKGH